MKYYSYDDGSTFILFGPVLIFIGIVSILMTLLALLGIIPSPLLLSSQLRFIIFGISVFIVGCLISCPKYTERLLAPLRKWYVLLLLLMWSINFVLLSKLFLSVPSGIHYATPGKAIKFTVGDSPIGNAIGGFYDSRVVSCKFLPEGEQRQWKFHPIAIHLTNDLFSVSKGTDDMLPGNSTRPIQLYHKIVLRKKEELWDTTLKFELILNVEWPELAPKSRNNYITKTTTVTDIVSVTTYPKHINRREEVIKPICFFIGIVPIIFVIASLVSSQVK